MASSVDMSPYANFLLEYKLAAEYNLLRRCCPPGVYVLPTSSPFVWEGVVFIRQGLYRGGVFKFSVEIPKSFPDDIAPRVTFRHKVYHPQVDPSSGEANLADGESPYKARLPSHVYQVLESMRSLFFAIDPTGAVDQEAEQLFKASQELFEAKVHKSVEECTLSALATGERDTTAEESASEQEIQLCEERWSQAMKAAMETAVAEKQVVAEGCDARVCGLSWVDHDSRTAFSKYR